MQSGTFYVRRFGFSKILGQPHNPDCYNEPVQVRNDTVYVIHLSRGVGLQFPIEKSFCPIHLSSDLELLALSCIIVKFGICFTGVNRASSRFIVETNFRHCQDWIN